MTTFTRPIAAALLFLASSFFNLTTVAQPKRQTPAKPQPKVAPAPPQTFDTLIPSERYNLYVEVRGVGQVIKSSSLNELIEPVLKLGGPPKEFRALVNWMNEHAEEVMTARMLVAAWPSREDLPEAVVAIDFASAEEAGKFASRLKEFLPAVLPPKPSEKVEAPAQKEKLDARVLKPNVAANAAEPLKPSYYVKQSGSIILLSSAPINFKKFKPAGSKLLSDDIDFRAARNRFASEPVFVFIDMKTMGREQRIKDEKMRVEMEKKAAEEAVKRPEEPAENQSANDQFKVTERTVNPAVNSPVGEVSLAEGSQPSEINPLSTALSLIAPTFLNGESKWPDAIALALSLESDSFDVRALLINQPGEKSDTVPFMPTIIPGQPIVPESPNILPADSELFVTLSLDLPQIYAMMSRPRPNAVYYTSEGNQPTATEEIHQSPFALIEKQLKLNLRDDVLPLLGSEIAIRLPVNDISIFGLTRTGSPDSSNKANANAAPLLLISLKDKEGVRALVPKIVEGLGFKGVSALAQTERRDDTEIVSYAGFFSYAFIGNFIVLSGDPATVRYVVDSYLKQETLASDAQFKNFTRWQPRPMHGQLYVSSALMESYKTWILSPQTRVSDQTRAILSRLTEVAQPITYSLSNEGLGPLHELHLPKNLVLMAVAGLSGETNPPQNITNERMTIGTLYVIANVQQKYRTDNGSFATLEQLVAEKLVAEDMIKLKGYKLELTVTGDKFEITAVPLEYGKSGTLSFYIDQTFVLRGGDRNGAIATVSDPPLTGW